jgi:SsrA-binding protein
MVEISNRRARFDYFVEDEIECGIELVGTEIKSFRKGSASIVDSYGLIRNNEVYLLNSYIAKYEEGNRFNHDERRERRLLLHKNEIIKIGYEIETKRYTLIPLKVYFKGNKVKIELALAQGKKLYDKRESIKEKDMKRRSERDLA